MALYPDATLKLLPENSTQPRIKPRLVILHTAVDAAGPTSLAHYFGRADVGAESHFFVRNHGEVEQYIDTEVMANANRYADRFAISIETEDDGDPEGNPWTGAQLEAIIRLLGWVCDTHGIPRSLAKAWDGSGIGWHSMWSFSDRINQRGSYLDSPWTIYRGKTCPGKTRILQLLDTVLPDLQRLGYRSAVPQEDEVTLIHVKDNIPGGGEMYFLVSPYAWAWIAQEHTLAYYLQRYEPQELDWYAATALLIPEKRALTATGKHLNL